MATKIKLMRLGKMRAPYYRIVVADARTKRDGRVIETIGKYHPKENPSFIEVDGDRAAYWLGVGAQATDPVERILKVTGDWQKFRGEAPPAPMRVAEPRTDKKAVFEAAARDSVDSAGAGAATTPKKKAAPKVVASDDSAPAGHAAPPADQVATATPAPTAADAPATDAPAGDAPAADAPGDSTPAADAPAADAPAADAPAADAPAAGAPAADAPAADPPADSGPAAGAPAADAPTDDAPAESPASLVPEAEVATKPATAKSSEE